MSKTKPSSHEVIFTPLDKIMICVPLAAGEGFYTWLEGKRHVSNFLTNLPDFSPISCLSRFD